MLEVSEYWLGLWSVCTNLRSSRAYGLPFILHKLSQGIKYFTQYHNFSLIFTGVIVMMDLGLFAHAAKPEHFFYH